MVGARQRAGGSARQPPPVPVTEFTRSGLTLLTGSPAQLLHFGAHHPPREHLDHLPRKIRGRGCRVSRNGGSYYFLDLTALGRQEEWEEPKGRSESARSATPDFAS